VKELMIFGEHPDGRVDVADVDGDVVTLVARPEAEALIQRYNHLVDMIESERMLAAEFLRARAREVFRIMPNAAAPLYEAADAIEAGEHIKKTN
jgi:hypothetical protein